MDTLLKKLDRLSSPLGSLLDAALERLVPHTIASAATCGSGLHYCHTTCTGVCDRGGKLVTVYYAARGTNCSGALVACGHGCGCF